MTQSEAFEVGYDCARFQVRIPEDQRIPDLMAGYRAGRRQFPHARRADRYHRKLLQLRRNALFRRSQARVAVDEVLLSAIDSDRCLVTLEPMTHETGQETDWSVDRVFNEVRCYAAGGLWGISAAANYAKGSLELAEILEIADRKKPYQGLEAQAWGRMAYALLGWHRVRDAIERGIAATMLFGEVVPLPGLPMPPAAATQILFGQWIADEDFVAYGYWADHFPRAWRAEFRKLAQHLARRVEPDKPPCLAGLLLGTDPALRRRFARLYDKMARFRPEALESLLDEILPLQADWAAMGINNPEETKTYLFLGTHTRLDELEKREKIGCRTAKTFGHEARGG